MQKIRREIETLLARHLESHPFWIGFADEHPDGFRAIRETVLSPGKRLRPLLFCAACRDAGTEPLPTFSQAVLALELVHSFILIHDDLIDRSAMRRGLPTLATRIDTLFTQHPADGFRGSDFALVSGDLLYIQSIECLMNVNVSAEQQAGAVRLFAQAALDTGRGALLEMRVAQQAPGELNLAQIEQLYALKTGSYTFALPLQLAALFCRRGSGEEHLGFQTPGKNLSAIGRHAGIAFQLQNDLAEIERWMDGGPLPDDLRDGRRTWPLVYAGSEAGLRDEKTHAAMRRTAEDHLKQAFALLDEWPGVRTVLEHALSGSG
jgi:geranylgeranyl diphosphate synthase, type I